MYTTNQASHFLLPLDKAEEADLNLLSLDTSKQLLTSCLCAWHTLQHTWQQMHVPLLMTPGTWPCAGAWRRCPITLSAWACNSWAAWRHALHLLGKQSKGASTRWQGMLGCCIGTFSPTCEKIGVQVPPWAACAGLARAQCPLPCQPLRRRQAQLARKQPGRQLNCQSRKEWLPWQSMPFKLRRALRTP